MRRALVALTVLAATSLGIVVTTQVAEASPCQYTYCTKVPTTTTTHCGGLFYSYCKKITRKTPVLYR